MYAVLRTVSSATVLSIALAACSAYGSLAPPLTAIASRLKGSDAGRPTGGLTILYQFQQSPDGQWPIGGVALDAKTGNIFGTTSSGGGSGSDGTVFELVPSGGTYDESIVYRFNEANNGLYFPTATPAENSREELFVAVQQGGPYNYGGAVKLSPSASGGYDLDDEFVLHPGQGSSPLDLMVKDGQSYYTTTDVGGEFNCGSILAFSPGKLKGEVVYVFKGTPDACGPLTDLFKDSTGVLYGASEYGGSSGHGALFKFQRSGSGVTESIVYSFPGGEGGQLPLGGVEIDKRGDIFGVTYIGGTAGFGTVYELTPNGSGYVEKVLHSFGGPPDGSLPVAGLTFLRGKLFGTTGDGGTGQCVSSGRGCGTIFELEPNGSHYRVAYAFQGNDGEDPSNGRLVANHGALYGATENGGSSDLGEVYEFVP